MATEGNGQALSSRLFYWAVGAVGVIVTIGFGVVLTIILFLNEQHEGRIVELEKEQKTKFLVYEQRITQLEIELENIKGK